MYLLRNRLFIQFFFQMILKASVSKRMSSPKFLGELVSGHSVYLIKEVKCGWQAWSMLTVMLVVSSEALKRGNFERINLCVQIVVSGLPSSCLPVLIRSKIRKSQPLPRSKICPSSSDRLKVWSSEYVASTGVMFVSGITCRQNENEHEEYKLSKSLIPMLK